LSRRLSVGALSALLLVLPFEPRRPMLPVLALELTLLEAVAAVAAAALLVMGRDRLGAIVRHPPLPLALLAAYVAASALSAAVAPMNRVLAAKFVLRMAASAVLALAVAAAPRDVPRHGLRALAAACAVVAVLAILEGTGVFALDPFLDRFRDGPYWIGTSRRATAGSENPNLAAAMLLYGLVPAVGAAALRGAPAGLVVPVTASLGLGLLFTYSRGGLAALTAALVVLGVAPGARGRAAARAPALAILTLVAMTVAFAAWKGLSGARLYTGAGAPSLAVAYAPGERFLSLAPGETREVPVTLTNTGTTPWSAATLGCTWRKAGGTLATDWLATAACPVTGVPRAAPGEAVSVRAAIRAPEAEGRYLLVWDLFADGWALSSRGVAPATVPSVVSRDPAAARPFAHSLPSATWRRGRAELWRAALAMWREHPLTGMGPDNFRWAHGANSSRPSGVAPETLVPANNLFLEAAASTGTLGLLALVGTLAATARAAWRALRRAAPASADAAWAATLLALTAGIVVHGAVDTLLGFTGHYLFLGLVVGAAAAEDRGGRSAV
jgi:O-antigen ligase/polysaccharide polymerase Wzy-like membrane protein